MQKVKPMGLHLAIHSVMQMVNRKAIRLVKRRGYPTVTQKVMRLATHLGLRMDLPMVNRWGLRLGYEMLKHLDLHWVNLTVTPIPILIPMGMLTAIRSD